MKRKYCEDHKLEENSYCTICKFNICVQCMSTLHKHTKIASKDCASYVSIKRKFNIKCNPDLLNIMKSKSLSYYEYAETCYQIYDFELKECFDVSIKFNRPYPFTQFWNPVSIIAAGSIFLMQLPQKSDNSYSRATFYHINFDPPISVHQIPIVGNKDIDLNFSVLVCLKNQYVYVFGPEVGLKYNIKNKKMMRAPIPYNHRPFLGIPTVVNDRFIVAIQGNCVLGGMTENPNDYIEIYIFILDALDEERGWFPVGSLNTNNLELPIQNELSSLDYNFEFDIRFAGKLKIMQIGSDRVLIMDENGCLWDLNIFTRVFEKWSKIVLENHDLPSEYEFKHYLGIINQPLIHSGKAILKDHAGELSISLLSRKSNCVSNNEKCMTLINYDISIPESKKSKAQAFSYYFELPKFNG